MGSPCGYRKFELSLESVEDIEVNPGLTEGLVLSLESVEESEGRNRKEEVEESEGFVLSLESVEEVEMKSPRPASSANAEKDAMKRKQATCRRVSFAEDVNLQIREISSLSERQVEMGLEPHAPKTIRHSHLPKNTRWTEKGSDVQLETTVKPHAGSLFARRVARRASVEPDSSEKLFEGRPRCPSL